MRGATIGQYRVTGVIGRGGMGAVYAAEHTLLGRPAAIKVLLPDLSQKQDIVLRFFNEARAATAIRHPGIVEIYDFGWTPDGAAFIVMERLDGETLARRVTRGRFRWQLALSVARQIAGALSAAHAKGIVHRDLKPDNIYLVLDPEVPGGERIKLLDFGIAKLAGESSPGANVTATGAVMGTPTYMSPEQCRGVSVDHRADLYALGCLVFEMCSGRPPFVGEGSGDVLAAHIHLPPPTLASQGVDAPAVVEQMLQRLLAKRPAQRVQTADDVIRAIDAVVTDAGRAASVVSMGPRPVSNSSPAMTTLSGSASTRHDAALASSRRRRSLAVVAGVAGALVVAVAALASRGGEGRVVHAPTISATALPAPAADDPPSRVEAPSVSGEAPSTAAPPAKPAEVAAPPANPTDVAVPPAKPAEVAVPPAKPTEVAVPPAKPTEVAVPSPAPEVRSPSKTPEAARKTEPAAPAKAAVVTPGPDPARSASSPASVPRRGATESAPPRPPATASATIAIAVDSVPAGAEVVLSGKSLGKTPFRGALPRRSDDIRLILRLTGYADQIVTVRGDRPVSQTITLVRAKAVNRRDESVNPF